MAVGMEEVEMLKPRNDQRQYRRIVLKNMLEVLLVSDPETDKAAASMNVGVGYFCDPDGLEGLAHFLEHMLFYASEKYPEEDTYSKYITEHGGSTNAFTSSENTNYHFDVNSDCFEEALDRFAQFFIKPLMSADATMREIKAVDSENQKNLLSDSWRMYQLQKHLTTESHPYHKFSTGNLETLNVRPTEKGIDTRLELLKFYEEYYSANLMHLVVYSKGSLDKLQNLVENKFEEIRNIDRSRPNFPGPLCSSEHTQIVVKTVPIKEGHKLRIVWPVTPSIHHYKEGPSIYLGHLIGHEGDGSLFHVLKTLGWASSLSASESEWSLDYSFFTVLIELTDAGHEHVQDIIALMFKYISLLQHSGVCKWIFDELSAVCETKFHYQDKTPPIDYVVNIATNMRFYPPRDWLVESSLPSVFNPEIIQTQLNELTVSNVRLFWASKKFEGHVDMVEPWYGTAYSLDKISLSTIQQWIVSAPSVNLHLPSPNIFIPTDFSIKNSREAKFPSLLRNSLSYNLWYKPDTMFKSPKAYVKIDFNCPYSSNSPEAKVLTDIFTRLLMDYLNEYAYYAQIAGLHYGVSHTDNGFQVTVTGYNHKLWILLETVIDKIAKFKVKPDRFLVIKEVVIKEYQNYKFQQPYQQAMYYCSILLQDQTWPWMEQLEVLPHLDSTDLEKFVPLMLSRTFLECYVAGNIECSEAESMVLHIEGILFNCPKAICQNVFPSQRTTNRVVKLRRGLSYYYPVEGLNQDDENSSLVHYIQVHQDDFLMNVKLQLIALVAKQSAFHQLRSVEQLGYIVALLQRNEIGVRGVQFIIQSTAKGPKSIDFRVESFLKSFESKLYEISDDEFKSNVNALIDMKLEKHKNLKEECRFYWQEISQGTLKFDRRESEVAALRELKKQELIDFFDKHIKNGAALKKALSVRVYGILHTSEYTTDNSDPPPANSVKIDDIFTFRGSQTLYGSLKCGYGLGKL